jgi:hypothetical protein
MTRQNKQNLTYVLYTLGVYMAYRMWSNQNTTLGEDYYGPPRPGQSYNQYNSFMQMPIVVGASGATIGALVAGPIGAIVGGVGSWIMSDAINKRKSPTQGG